MTKSTYTKQTRIIFIKDNSTGAVKEISTVGRIINNRRTYSPGHPIQLTYQSNRGNQGFNGGKVQTTNPTIKPKPKKKCCGK